MESQKQFIKLAKEVTNTIKPLKEIKSISIYGAVALGFQDKYSDIDLVALCDEIPKIEKRKKILDRLKNTRFIDIPNKSGMDYFVYKETDISIEYKKIKEFERLIREFKKGEIIFEQFSTVISKFYFGKSLYDPKGIFRRLKKKVPKPKFNIGIIGLVDYLNKTCNGDVGPIGDRLKKAIERKNLINIHLEFSSLINAIIIVLYTLNGFYYLTPKWVPSYIKKMKLKPKNTEKKLNELSRLGNSPSLINKKRRILKSLVEDLNKVLRKSSKFKN